MYGSDQAASLEPNALRLLIGGIRKIEKAMGNGLIEVQKKEIPIAKKLRGHILQGL
jgi:N-acetylneuraminate synthase